MSGPAGVERDLATVRSWYAPEAAGDGPKGGTKTPDISAGANASGVVMESRPNDDRLMSVDPNASPAGAAQLVKGTSASRPLPAASPPRTLPANTSNQRTASTPADAYARAGKTGSGDSVFAEASVYKGTTADGDRFNLVGGSVQVGLQNEVQITGAKASREVAPGVQVGFEALTARAAAGIHNENGSTGLNVGATGTLVAATVDYDDGKGTTLGASLGLSAGFNYGFGKRDADGDGIDENCFHGNIPFLAVDACAEPSTSGSSTPMPSPASQGGARGVGNEPERPPEGQGGAPGY